MAVYAVHEVTVQIDTTPLAVPTLAEITDLESVELTINNEVQDWTSLDKGGWKSRLITGKDLELSFSGKRNTGDTGNDYVAGLADKMSTDLETTITLTIPGGETVTIPGTVEVTSIYGGESLDVGMLEFNFLSNGAPTFA